MQCPLGAPLPALSGLHPTSWLVELEVLGPLATIAPGGATSLDVGWVVHRAP